MGWLEKTVDFIWDNFLIIIDTLLKFAIWVVELVVEIAHITDWFKKRQGSTKTGGIADGKEFADFIKHKKAQGQCGKISFEELERIGKSAINFTDNESQMISGKNGLGSKLKNLLKENGGLVEIPL